MFCADYARAVWLRGPCLTTCGSRPRRWAANDVRMLRTCQSGSGPRSCASSGLGGRPSPRHIEMRGAHFSGAWSVPTSLGQPCTRASALSFRRLKHLLAQLNKSWSGSARPTRSFGNSSSGRLTVRVKRRSGSGCLPRPCPGTMTKWNVPEIPGPVRQPCGVRSSVRCKGADRVACARAPDA